MHSGEGDAHLGGSCSTSSIEEAGMVATANPLEISGFTLTSARRRPTKDGCIVAGCSTVLTTKYETRYRLCTAHMKAPQFLIAGELHRWCQKCGKFHLLDEFDGNRKSCRAALERHNDKQKKLRLRKQAAAAAAAVTSSSPTSTSEEYAPVEVPLVSDSGMVSEASASPPPLPPPSSVYTVEVAEVPTHPGAAGRLSPLIVGTPFNGPEGLWSDALAAAFPPLPSVPMCDDAVNPQELDDFIAEMLLEPSVTLEGLSESMDVNAFLDAYASELPTVLDLPLLM